MACVLEVHELTIPKNLYSFCRRVCGLQSALCPTLQLAPGYDCSLVVMHSLDTTDMNKIQVCTFAYVRV